MTSPVQATHLPEPPTGHTPLPATDIDPQARTPRTSRNARLAWPGMPHPPSRTTRIARIPQGPHNPHPRQRTHPPAPRTAQNDGTLRTPGNARHLPPRNVPPWRCTGRDTGRSPGSCNHRPSQPGIPPPAPCKAPSAHIAWRTCMPHFPRLHTPHPRACIDRTPDSPHKKHSPRPSRQRTPPMKPCTGPSQHKASILCSPGPR